MEQVEAEDIIRFENVSYTYPGEDGVLAINKVSFSVKKGEFLSVIGHNGSGKSTLARLMNGLLEADEGKIYILGEDMDDSAVHRKAPSHVGIVFQNPDNQQVASIVEDDVAFGPENLGIPREEIGQRVDWALKAVDMEKYRDGTPSRLSGGQKQRVAVAGALALKPEVLILDEATAMLDPRGRREVIDVVSRLNREEGMTVILITHFMEEALLADRTIVMNRGEIVLTGTPEEIFENGESLETFNLALPRITVIANKLRSAGMTLSNMLKPEQLAEEITENMREKGIFQGESSPYTEKETESSHEWDVDIQHLSYTYSSTKKKSPFATKALDDVSLHIDSGEFFGIIGHTGSGKSTIIMHLNALIKLPQADKKQKVPKAKRGQPAPVLPQITVGKFNLADKKCDFKSLRAAVGMVFQYPEAQLFADTVFADVAFGLKNFRKGISQEEIEAAVRASIEIVGLNYDEVAQKSPFDLSGGQRRRVAIAGVLVTRPHILVLDEPAAGLDPKGKQEIMELLHKIHGEWCETVIIVSHDMDEIGDNCSHVAVISEGKVFACDTPARLFERLEELRALGLDAPLTSKVAALLKDDGYLVHNDCSADDFAEKVIEIYSGGKSNE
ncbi:MAG: energy-coupling factor transporter ATPase [Clostridia bacterium]|nr:energy-coupling factor transporter ATPase [Clostridia bacterium]